MGLEVARGMQALEESVPPILHRDLKPTNIFVGVTSSQCEALKLICQLSSLRRHSMGYYHLQAMHRLNMT